MRCELVGGWVDHIAGGLQKINSGVKRCGMAQLTAKEHHDDGVKLLRVGVGGNVAKPNRDQGREAEVERRAIPGLHFVFLYFCISAFLYFCISVFRVRAMKYNKSRAMCKNNCRAHTQQNFD